MSKKELLSETQIRRFQTLANIPVLGGSVLAEGDGQIPQDAPDRRDVKKEDEARLKEEMPPDMGMGAEDPMAALPAEAPPMDGSDELEVDVEGGDVDPDKQAAFEAAVRALADSMGIEVELEGGAGGEEGEEMDMGDEGPVDMGDEGPVDMGGGEGEEVGAEEAGEEEVDEALSEDELVETVLNRVMSRLVNEAKKKKKSVKEKMKDKKEKKKEDKEELDEATDPKGGGPLLSKGGNKHDTFKGHADMKLGKGEKGGTGGHKMEDLPAKAGHTVTHGKTNLSTKGGNKKKV